MNVQVLFHDNCFDGAASAAVFTRFYRERIRKDASFRYQGLTHKPGAEGIDPAVFTGDENAIVDFRYTSIYEVPISKNPAPPPPPPPPAPEPG